MIDCTYNIYIIYILYYIYLYYIILYYIYYINMTDTLSHTTKIQEISLKITWKNIKEHNNRTLIKTKNNMQDILNSEKMI